MVIWSRKEDRGRVDGFGIVVKGRSIAISVFSILDNYIIQDKTPHSSVTHLPQNPLLSDPLSHHPRTPPTPPKPTPPSPVTTQHNPTSHTPTAQTHPSPTPPSAAQARTSNDNQAPARRQEACRETTRGGRKNRTRGSGGAGREKGRRGNREGRRGWMLEFLNRTWGWKGEGEGFALCFGGWNPSVEPIKASQSTSATIPAKQGKNSSPRANDRSRHRVLIEDIHT